MSDVQVSVIVPVYNVEKYLRCCLESIRGQSYRHFQCICIDDGSTDNSRNILKEFAEKDSRFEVIRVDNGGVSAARNEGVRRARGEYISFLDSDDFVHPQYLEIMLNDLQKAGVDVTSCCYEKVPADATYNSHNSRNLSRCDLKRHGSFLQALVGDEKNIDVVVWNKLYKAGFVKKYPFNEDLKAHEDNIFMLQVACDAGPIFSNSAKLVYYRDTPKSLSKHTNTEWKTDYLNSWLQSVHQLDGLSLDDERLLTRCTTRLLYKEIVKIPVRQTRSDPVQTLAKSRNRLIAIKNDGQFKEKYLPLNDRFVCKLLLAGYCKVVRQLHCNGLLNWRLYFRQRMCDSRALGNCK